MVKYVIVWVFLDSSFQVRRRCLQDYKDPGFRAPALLSRPLSLDSPLAVRDRSLLPLLTLAYSRARLWRIKANG